MKILSDIKKRLADFKIQINAPSAIRFKGSLFLLGFVSFNLSSQITITGNDLPQSGYTYLTATDTTPTILLGTPGPTAQNWNFSSLSQDYPSYPTYGATSWTTYSTSFAASNLYTYGPAALYSSFYGSTPVNSQSMNNGYMFWKADNTGFRIIGFRAASGTYSNVNVYENPTELLIGTPATYGTAFNNTGRYVFPFNINSMDVDTYYVNRVTKTLTSDAWGSLTTPFGTFPNVLRIHEYLIRIDSAYGKIGTTPVYSMEIKRDTLNNYIYITNNLHYPACIVHANKNNVVKTVEYYTGVLMSVNEKNTQEYTNVYPNPFNNICYIKIPDKYKAEAFTVRITDVTGKQYTSYSINANEIIINANNYSSGIYFFELINADGISLKGKFVVAK